MTEESAFHARTSPLTSRFAPARDVWLPRAYDASGALEEYWACREAATLQDMSSLLKYDIMGPDAEALLQKALTKDVARLALHRGAYALICDEAGAVIDDGTLFRIAPGVFRWCCGQEEGARHLKRIATAEGLRVWIASINAAMPSLALQGPLSARILREVAFTQPHVPALANLKWFGCTMARLGDREGAPFMLTRTGFTGELGYEIFCHREDATEIWDTLLRAGAPYGLVPMGGEALEMLRIEAGLMSGGAEFGPEVNAFEAGLGFAVDFRKHDFVGRAALLAAQDAPQRRLVGLLFEGDEPPAPGDGVYAGERRVGTVTSATWSPMLKCAIAMARVSDAYLDNGRTDFEVGRLDGRMKRLGCRTTALPFVDPERKRPRAAPFDRPPREAG